ncbi:MAG: glycosyltransferase family A protein [Patescibacteria group bacterium]
MKISFVIPAYNEEHHLGACLESIMRELDGERHDVEIIVVDNDSTDRTAEVARRYPGVRVVAESHKGIVWARARGFREATGELIANVDADAMLTPGWIERVFREFERHPRLVCISGPLIYHDLSPGIRFLVKLFYGFGFFFYLLARFVFRSGSLVQGGNFVLRREALERAGGFDTTIDFYGEDTDIARRLSRLGPVKFTFGLPMLSSGRRLAEEGVLAIGLRYAANYLWVLFSGKPLTTASRDVRPGHHS